MGRGRQAVDGLEKPAFEPCEFHRRHSGSRHKEQVERGVDAALMESKQFAKPAFREVATMGFAHGGCGRDDADAWPERAGACGGGSGLRRGIAREPPQRERPAVQPAAPLPHGANVALAAKMLLRAIAHGAGPDGGAGRGSEVTESDHRQALTAFLTAGGEHFAAALGLRAGAEADLAGALFAMRTEGWFHGM